MINSLKVHKIEFIIAENLRYNNDLCRKKVSLNTKFLVGIIKKSFYKNFYESFYKINFAN